jgi:hypothetical protein
MFTADYFLMCGLFNSGVNSSDCTPSIGRVINEMYKDVEICGCGLFQDINLYNCSCDCLYSFCVVCFLVCVVLCSVFCLSMVLFCVMCVISVLCLIVVPLPPGKNPFVVNKK